MVQHGILFHKTVPKAFKEFKVRKDSKVFKEYKALPAHMESR